MAIATADLEIEAGISFEAPISIVDETDAPVDLTGYEAVLQIRRNQYRATPLLTLTTDDYLIREGNVLTIEIPADMSAELPIGNHYYDLLLRQGEVVYLLLSGRCNITGVISRWA